MVIEAGKLQLEEIDSEADFILCNSDMDVLSEHCTIGEARMALYHEAGRFQLGEHLPVIYRREESFWVPLS